MKIVTVATKKERYFPYLVESCKRNECELVVLGWGQPWTGYSMKLSLINDFLDSQSDNEIVCFVDAYDVIILQHRDVILNRFHSIVGDNKDKVLFSQDRGPEYSLSFALFNFFIHDKCNGIYLNSGTYIGYVRAIKDLLKKLSTMTYSPAENDQVVLQRYCHNIDSSKFLIDSQKELFLVASSISSTLNRKLHKIDIRNNKLYFGEKTPCILHASGNTNIDDILRDLGYSNDLFSANDEDNMDYIIKTAKDYIYWFIRYNYIKIIIFILVILLVFVVILKRKQIRSFL